MIALTSIYLHNQAQVELDDGMLHFAMARVARQIGPGRTRHIDVFTDARQTSGRLEWGMNIQYEDGGKLFLRLIQRTSGAAFESHS